jgi:ubiquitin-like modifier-activating enzyme 5
MNIIQMPHYESFIQILKTEGSISDDVQRHVDLVLGCVDNFQARIAINMACLELGLPWMESGVSEDAMSGHIQSIFPGKSACFQCAPPLIVASGISESTLKREGVCAASLPTTMAITAGLLSQNTLKYLLGFGDLSAFQGYNGMTNFFPAYEMKPNEECQNSDCRKWQIKVKEQAEKAGPKANTVAIDAEPIHEDNEWNITVEDVSEPVVAATAYPLPAGIAFKYAAADFDEIMIKTLLTSVINEDTSKINLVGLFLPTKDLRSMYKRVELVLTTWQSNLDHCNFFAWVASATGFDRGT